MPRNGSGIYSPPPGTTIVPNTLADATAMEIRLSDLGAEISASMPLNGVRPMTGPLLLVPGSAAAPGMAFAGDTSSGLAQVASRTALVKGGVAGISSSATDVQAHLPMTTADLTVTGSLSAPGTLVAGMMMEWAGATAPAGWVFAAGQVLLRVSFPALFTAIGTLHNTGGELGTEFRLPDARGCVVAAPDNMGGTNAGRMASAGSAATTVGGRYGGDTHILTTPQMPGHTHSGTTDNAGAHDHTVPGSPMGGGGSGGIPSLSSGGTQTTSGAPAHAHPFTTASAGGGAAHNNVQPTLFIPKIIKT